MKIITLLIFSCVFVVATFAQSTSLSGAGTVSDPYLIQSIDDLKFLRDQTNLNAINNYQGNGKYFKLTSDINLENENWSPIGVGSGLRNSFRGFFDGNGHTVYNLRIGSPTDSANISNAGLFGVTRRAEIKNIRLHDVRIYQAAKPNQDINLNAGILIGNADTTTIENSYAQGSLYAYNYSITNKGFYIGGMVGYCRNINIYNSSSDVEIVGNATVGTAARPANAGGLVGLVQPNGTIGTNIKNCITKGSVHSISSATATGSFVIVGGVVGNFQGPNVTGVRSTLENCITISKIKATTIATSTSIQIIIAGLLGSNAGGNNVSNCISNNDSIIVVTNSITTGGKYINRISGNGTGTIANNYANGSMVVIDNGTNVTLAKGLTTDDGADLGTNIPATLLNSYCASNTAPTGFSWRNWTAFTVSSNDNSKGAVSGSQTLFQNEDATVLANPASNNKFIHWLNGATVISTLPQYTLNTGVNSSLNIQGRFAPIRSEQLNSGTVNINEISDAPAANIEVQTGTLIVNDVSSINSLSVQSGASVSVNNALQVDGDFILYADKNDAPSVKVDAALTLNGDFKVYKKIDNTKWYFISFPTNVAVNDITKISGIGTMGELGTNWWIRYYDGASRVSNLGTTSNWKNIKTGATLNANQGYIIGLANSLTGDYVLSFPLSRNLISSAETVRSVAVVNHGEGSVAANHVGWNLVGLPYLSKFNGGQVGAAYLTFHNGTNYTQLENTAVTEIKPFSAFFVQASTTGTGANLGFNILGRQLSKSIVELNPVQKYQILVNQQSGIDKTTLIVDDTQNSEYMIGKDLEKWISTDSNLPQIYSIGDNIRYAFNALNNNEMSNIALGVFSKIGGQISISVPLNANLNEVQFQLYDIEKGSFVDLNNSEYKCTVNPGFTNNRFKLSVKRVSTDLRLNNNSALTYLIKGNCLIINQAQKGMYIRISDLAGRVVVQRITTGTTEEFNLSSIQKGAYLLELQFNNKINNCKFIY